VAVEHDEEAELGNGDTLEGIKLEEDETCSTDEMRDRLDL
jgi:formylmethanofuran dehydrogenase subunit B